MSIDEWITTADAAKISGYHVNHIRRLIRSGRVDARKFGPVWQVNRHSLLAFVKQAEESGDNRRGPK